MGTKDGATLDSSVRPLPTLDAMIAAKEKGVIRTLKSTFNHRVEVMGAKKVDEDGICEKYEWNE